MSSLKKLSVKGVRVLWEVLLVYSVVCKVFALLPVIGVEATC